MSQSGHIFNQHKELEKRRALRKTATLAERALWSHIREQKIEGARFRRQFSVGAFVLDFYCPALKLAIEVDGSSHDGDDAQERDTMRQQNIEALGIRFLRFTNQEVLAQTEGVVQAITTWIQQEKQAAS